ncbi:MAG: hypothetical protein OEZ29_02275, partial [Candidatus Bathyarchaeota archaeon]|nr:hypothetical protein [Candidatus Bathyarchaeota archaeon]
MDSNRTSKISEVRVKRVEKPPYVVDQSKLHRFNSRNIIFDRVMWDSSWEGYMRMYDEKVLDIIAEENR